MKLTLLAGAFSFLVGAPAYAALPLHASAPVFSAQASLAGKPMTFSLADALKQGPVVLYFFPKAFTRGCTYEAKAFADATERFSALGATVVGVSNDPIETQNRFSVEACIGKFAVVADPDSKIITLYRTNMWASGVSDRVSYVITPDDKVIFAYANTDPDKHVELALRALTAWATAHPKK